MRDDPEVLLNHAAPDLAWARWVRAELEAAGYRVRTAAWEPTWRGTAAASARLRTARRAVVLVSAPYPGWAGPEGMAALMGRDGDGLATLLVGVDEDGPPADLAGRVEVDLARTPDARAARALLRWGLHRHGMPTRPCPEGTGTAERYPGHGPRTCDLARRNPAFTGRRALLRRLRDLFTRPGPAGPRAVALHGTGGVGKTELALEYGHRYRSGYDLIWWVDAQRPACVESALSRLADALGVPAVPHADERIALLHGVLRRRSRWLLVFDGATGEDTLRPYWPPGDGHVLVTSRNAGWPLLVEQTLTVEGWSRAESVAFLGRLPSGPGHGVADALAAELGDLPLALAQAAAHVTAGSLTLTGYRERFDRYRRSGPGRPAAWPWHMSIEEADRIRPGARDLLILLSFCGTERVPRTLPSDHAQVLPPRLAAVVGTAEGYARTVAVLAEYALLTARPGELAVHSLVQLAVRSALPPGERRRWAETTLHLLERALPEDVGETAAPPLVPQVEAACDIAGAYGAAPELIAGLLHRTGRYLNACGDYETARRLLERALTLREGPAGPDDLAVADTLAALTAVHVNLADLTAAERAARHGLDIRERRLGPGDARVADLQSELGRVLRERNRLEEARQRSARALQIAEDLFGPGHPRVADHATYLGIVLWRCGRTAEALAAHHRALRIRARLGPPHRLASPCKHIGLLYRDLGRFDLAERFLRRGAQILRSALGPGHLATVEMEIHLGDVRRLLGFTEEAVEALARARRQRELHLAPGHPDLALCLVKLGAALRDAGRLEEAEEALLRARDIYLHVRGEDHPYVAEALVQLGSVRRLLGDAQGAVETLRRAVRIFEDGYGPYHPALAEAWECLAPLLAERGDHAEAARWAENATAVRRSAARGIDWTAITPPPAP